MSAFAGPLGGLRELTALSALDVTPIRKTIDHEPIGGGLRRIKYPTRRRIWTARKGVIPVTDLARLKVLADVQDEAWWFIPDDAPGANVMTPDGSILRDWTTTDGAKLFRGGAIATEDGLAVTSVYPDYTGDDWRYSSRPIPIHPDGRDVTIGVYMVATVGGSAAQARAVWVDGYGTQVFGSSTPTIGSTTVDAAPLPRVAGTLTPAAGAHAVVIQTRRAAVMANASVTWTDHARPWAEGKTAERAWLEDPADGLHVTHPVQLHTVAFQVVEEAE